jgi:hypothetical protein
MGLESKVTESAAQCEILRKTGTKINKCTKKNYGIPRLSMLRKACPLFPANPKSYWAGSYPGTRVIGAVGRHSVF